MTDQNTLAAIEDVIRTMPERHLLHGPSSAPWLGRALAALHDWDFVRSAPASRHVNTIVGVGAAIDQEAAASQLMVLLHQAASELRMRTIGPVNEAVGQGEVFRYFEALRGVIEMASTDILFVDRYMGAEFIARFMPLVGDGVSVRLLTRNKPQAVASAAAAYTNEHGTQIEVRTSEGFHDRWVFIDKREAYLSGASFKDGGKSDSTTLTQNVDLFPALLDTYENLWSNATHH